MKKCRLRVCAIAFLLAAASVVSCLIVPSSAEGSDAKVQSYEEQMQDLQKKQEDAQARIAETKNDINNAVEYKKAIDETLEVTYSKIYLSFFSGRILWVAGGGNVIVTQQLFFNIGII